MRADKILDAVSTMMCAAIVIFSMIASVSAGRGKDAAYPAESEKAVLKANVFTDFRRERQDVRNLEIRQLNGIIENPDTDEEIRNLAHNEIMTLTKNMEAEATIEAVLIARGHKNAVVTVHPGSVNVVIETGYDNKAESAFILDLVMRETGQTAGNVKIMTV